MYPHPIKKINQQASKKYQLKKENGIKVCVCACVCVCVYAGQISLLKG